MGKEFNQRVEDFKKQNIKADYLLFKITKVNQNSIKDKPVEYYSIKAILAESAIDIPNRVKNFLKDGAVLIHGNFPNLRETSGRVASLKEPYDMMSFSVQNYQAQAQATAEVVNDKNTEKLDEVKKRLGK